MVKILPLKQIIIKYYWHEWNISWIVSINYYNAYTVKSIVIYQNIFDHKWKTEISKLFLAFQTTYNVFFVSMPEHERRRNIFPQGYPIFTTLSRYLSELYDILKLYNKTYFESHLKNVSRYN